MFALSIIYLHSVTSDNFKKYCKYGVKNEKILRKNINLQQKSTCFQMAYIMKKYLIYFVIFWICQFFDPSECRKRAKFVTTSIDAKWDQTPLVLEIAEFLADENINSFWSFINDVNNLEKPLSTLGNICNQKCRTKTSK